VGDNAATMSHAPHLRTFVVAASSLNFSTGFSGVNWNLESFHFTILSAISFSRLRMSGTAALSAKNSFYADDDGFG
jgi:paraquat-inducible protein B